MQTTNIIYTYNINRTCTKKRELEEKTKKKEYEEKQIVNNNEIHYLSVGTRQHNSLKIITKYRRIGIERLISVARLTSA
jgi:hypothetical protein